MNDRNNETKRKRNSSPVFSAVEKCRAVLSIWTERVKPADVCREMGVTWMHIKHWQDRALEGMMQALETRSGLAVGSALTPRLRALLEKRQGSEGMTQLEQKLARLQETRTTRKPLRPAQDLSRTESGNKNENP